MSEPRSDTVEEQLLRERPERLLLRKRRTRKADGRSLIYFDFRREPAAGPREREG